MQLLICQAQIIWCEMPAKPDTWGQGMKCGIAEGWRFSSQFTPDWLRFDCFYFKQIMMVQETVLKHFDILHGVQIPPGPVSAHYHAWFGARAGILLLVNAVLCGRAPALSSQVVQSRHCRSFCSSVLTPHYSVPKHELQPYPNCTGKLVI